MAPRYAPPRGFKLAQLRPLLAAAAPVPFPPSLFFRFAFFSLLLLHSSCKISFPVMAQADENSQQFLRVRATFPVCNKQVHTIACNACPGRPKRFNLLTQPAKVLDRNILDVSPISKSTMNSETFHRVKQGTFFMQGLTNFIFHACMSTLFHSTPLILLILLHSIYL